MFTPNHEKDQPNTSGAPPRTSPSIRQKEFTPLRASKAKISHAIIKKQLINCLHKGYYTRLKNDIDSYNLSPKDIEAFFEKEGSAVLSFALVSAPNAVSFDFLCEQFAHALIKKAIFSAKGTKRAATVVGDFLLSQSGLEEMGFDSPEQRSIRICKFISLLKFDPTSTQEFITHADKDYVTDKIRKDFEIALKLYQETLTPTAPGRKRKGDDLEVSQQSTKQQKGF